jgi:hypothetical protein
MLRDEIKTDIDFLRRHDLQPKWWKFGKILVLAVIIVAMVLLFEWKSVLIWFGTMLACMGAVHFMYRAKTKKYTVAWADFRVDAGDKRSKFGVLYYPLVAVSFTLAFAVMLLARGR